MSVFIVEKEYINQIDNPIQLSTGDKVTCVKESDSLGDWPNWIYCKSDDNEGWVPKQIIDMDNEIVTEDYNAIEFNLSIGEILVSEKNLNGWIWCYKKGNIKDKAWAPLNHLKLFT